MTCVRIGLPAISFRGLSPPPMRRASPPARIMPQTGASPIRACALAAMARIFFLDARQVLVEDNALRTGDDGESFAAHAANQRQPSLVRKLNAPRGEAGARDEYGNAHPHRLDRHAGRRQACAEKNPVSTVAACR